MAGMFHAARHLSRGFNLIAGISITFIMLLTVSDVILRFFRRPIIGTFEVVALVGALVIGFAMPATSVRKGHICVDFFVMKFSGKVQAIFNIVTRCAVIALFILITWNMVKEGMHLQGSGEVTPTRQLPFYPVHYALAVCFLMQCFVLLCEIVNIIRGKK